MILTAITAEGLRLLEQLDAPVADLHHRQLAHLDAEQLRALLALLENARGLRIDDCRLTNGKSRRVVSSEG